MDWFRKRWRLVILHSAALGIVAHTFTQGTVNVHMEVGFDPGLASGKWAIRFLLLCLAVTPLNSYLRWRWAIPLRKWLGLWAFAFAVLHLAVYLYSIELSDSVDWTLLLRQMATQVYLILGALSLLILSALALTSNQAAMRLLKQNWKRLHRLVYGAGAMVVIHALLSMRMSKKVIIRDPNALPELWLYLALMILLLALRIPAVKRALEEPSKRLRRGLAGERA